MVCADGSAQARGIAERLSAGRHEAALQVQTSRDAITAGSRTNPVES